MLSGLGVELQILIAGERFMFRSSIARSARALRKVKPARQTRYGEIGRRFELLETRAMLSVSGDFNNDGRADLAIGVSRESVDGKSQAGAVQIIYGSATGLAAKNNQLFTQNTSGLAGSAGTNDHFGQALAAGDFNKDGIDDLAIGVPGDPINSKSHAGSVTVLYGSSKGLKTTSDQQWHQDSSGISDSAEANDQFGASLAAGDFNGDGRDDLAIGVPQENSNAGQFHVLYGTNSGLSSSQSQVFSQDSSGINDAAEAGDKFGKVLAAGDFDHNGRDDLAIGIPDEALGSATKGGAVSVIYGTSSGLSGSGDQFFTQDSSGISDAPESNDLFGAALAAADFNGDSSDDLTIGVPGEAGSVGGDNFVGMGHELFGGSGKLSGSGSQTFTRLLFADLDASVVGLGGALAAGDFNHDGKFDLAVGLPLAGVNGQAAAGMAIVAYGTVGGLTDVGAQVVHQDGTGIQDTAEAGDNFGAAVTAGDYNGDGRDDLALGVPKESFSFGTATGCVQIVFGAGGGLTSSGNQRWTQNSTDILDDAEDDDQFGSVIA